MPAASAKERGEDSKKPSELSPPLLIPSCQTVVDMLEIFFFLEHNQQIALDKRFCLDCQNAGASTIPGKTVPEREKEKNKNETTQMDFAVHHH